MQNGTRRSCRGGLSIAVRVRWSPVVACSCRFVLADFFASTTPTVHIEIHHRQTKSIQRFYVTLLCASATRPFPSMTMRQWAVRTVGPVHVRGSWGEQTTTSGRTDGRLGSARGRRSTRQKRFKAPPHSTNPAPPCLHRWNPNFHSQ